LEVPLRNMKKKLRVIRIEGISTEYFKEFEELGLELEFHTEGPKNEWGDKVVEYIIISTLVFPFDFVKDILKDQTKVLLFKVITTISTLWEKTRNTKPALVKSGEDPEFKEPKIAITFPISEDEISTLEISSEVSESLTKEALSKYFELLDKQIQNRAEEEKLKAKVKFKIKSKRR